MWTDASLQPIYDADQYEDTSGTTYPDNFPKAQIAGLTSVTLTAQPDTAIYAVSGFTIDATHTQVWNSRLLTAPELAANLATSKANFIRKVDADVDAIYGAVVGNRATEYSLAETDAIAYKSAGYAGTVESSVQSWATAKAQTATWAANDIIATANAWRAAQTSIRLNRLANKENARNAASLAALSTVSATWAGYLAAIKTQLGL